MDEYRIEEMGKGWRVCQPERGTIGVVSHQGGRFKAMIDDDRDGRVIGYGQTVKAAVEQVIWYDRAMNQEAE